MAELIDCPACGRPVYPAIDIEAPRGSRSSTILIDPEPSPDGDLRLHGFNLLHKPIAEPRPGELPGMEPRYRVHSLSCAAVPVPA